MVSRPMPFLVYDNFFANPSATRALALAKAFTTKTGYFPGTRSVNQYRAPELHEFCLNATPLLAGSGSIKIQHACFQFMGKGRGQRKSYIHSDPVAGYAGIVFLGNRAGTYPGTSFFRHKLTGLDCFKSDNREWIRQNFPDQVAYRRAENLLDKDRFHLIKWEKVATLEARFNRLILFPAALLHKNASAWGTNPKNGRLTYNFWLGLKR